MDLAEVERHAFVVASKSGIHGHSIEEDAVLHLSYHPRSQRKPWKDVVKFVPRMSEHDEAA